MKEVAARANVSQATVSRVIHSPSLVKDSTRMRILQAMEETSYVYNSIAADFTRQRNSIIGLVVFTIRGSIQSDFIDGIQEELDRKRYSLIIGNSHYDPDTERHLLQLFHERQVAGIIIAESTDDNREQLEQLHSAGIPTILTWELTKDTTLDCVGIDNRSAAQRMTEHLISMGHRRIGFIAGRFDRIDRVHERLNGYRSALENAGIEFEPALAKARTPTAMDGKLAMLELLSQQNRPSAVFAASDALALGALAAARDEGLNVPDDVSICGFDDLDFAKFCNPPLTTVRVPTYEMGRRAAQAITDRTLHADHTPIRVSLETEIIVRDSCTKYRSSGN